MAAAGAPAQWRGVLLQNFIQNSTSLIMRVEVLIKELENFSSCLYFACNTNACTQLTFWSFCVHRVDCCSSKCKTESHIMVREHFVLVSITLLVSKYQTWKACVIDLLRVVGRR